MIHIVLFYEPPLISHTEINLNLWDGWKCCRNSTQYLSRSNPHIIPDSPPRLLDAVVTSERCGSPQFSSNIFLFDTLEGSFTRIQTWLPGKLDHNFVLDTDTSLGLKLPRSNFRAKDTPIANYGQTLWKINFWHIYKGLYKPSSL